MTKAKKSIFALISLVLVLTIIGTTYMWFFNEKSLAGKGKAAYIDLIACTEDVIVFDNILPGEPINLMVNPFWYKGNRDAIIQFKAEGEGSLYPGNTTHRDWLALAATPAGQAILDADYVLDGGVYKMTDKRLQEVLSLRDTKISAILKPVYKSKYEPNTYYTYVTASDSMIFNLLSLISLQFSGELGGGRLGSPSRQFEQQSSYDATGVKLSAVQITPEAIEDVLGANALKDVEDMVSSGFFTPGAEWSYVA